MLLGCRGRVEQVFIIKNDNGFHRNVTDCFISVLSPPGEIPRDYNVKTISMYFRDDANKIVLVKTCEYSTRQIKPKINWSAYPKVQISFQSDGEIDRVYFVTLPEKTKDEQASQN